MTADDDLQHAFATLTGHLHEEIGRQIEQVTAELAAAALEERERAVADATAEAARQADRRIADLVTSTATERADAEARAREEGRQIGIEEGRFEGYEQGKTDGLAQAREELDKAAHTGNSSDHAATERLADAVRTLDRARSLSEILDTVASCAGREASRVAVMLAAGGQYRGWRFIGFDPSYDTASQIDLSPEAAGIIDQAARSGLPAAADDNTASHPFGDVQPGCDPIAFPLVLSGEVVAVMYTEVERQQARGRSDRLDVLARHAARCLETVTALKAARLQAAPAPLAAMSDASALRYAKLLISEIRMYHEAEVAAGVRERDLATRLGGEIARARVLYEERVPAHVRQGADHFHDELVRTLANGDAELIRTGS